MAGMSSNPADRVKRGLFALIRGARPSVDYHALYRAEVLVQSQDRATVDVRPDDPRLPPMARVPLKLGIPGVTAQIAPGAGVVVGWENGDPSQPRAHLFDKGAAVIVLSISADKIELGGEGLRALLDEVVVGQTTCQFSGSPHHIVGNTSKTVLAKG